ncbi:MAG: AMIN domain-containing protein, partial [Gammaproteobacteria bacterium]|nr:AMIN domain-containing protein [Gammaproteobacteria bacterium]
MRVMTRKFCYLIGLAILSHVLPAVSGELEEVRGWAGPTETRIVFELTTIPDYRIFRLHKPERLVIDLKDTELKTAIALPVADDRFVERVRNSRRNAHDLRVVLDLKAPINIHDSVLTANDDRDRHRLVVDLSEKRTALTAKDVTPQGHRDVVIAIDAGHGGVDPGAKGYNGTYEKDVVLAVARRLASLIAKEPGMRPVLTRDGDYFITLRKRTAIARAAKADLFISLHADSFHNTRARGTSIYVLSEHGASDEASRWLAQKENEADLVGGVSLDDKDDLLASVLLDMSQSATNVSSFAAANDVLQSVGGVGHMHKRLVQQAGFVVLKSPDIPSMLIETAFITNPGDEKQLNSSAFQERLAMSILKGIRQYFVSHPLEGTVYAGRK